MNKKARPWRRHVKKTYPVFQVTAKEMKEFLFNFSCPQKKRPNSICNYPVYLILKYEYLKKIFQNKELHFCNVKNNWPDVYELFYAKNNFFTSNKEIIDPYEKFPYTIYGQSWSYNKSSDAMWRIYSDIKDYDISHKDGNKSIETDEFNRSGVRIKTTLFKLYALMKENALQKGIEPLMGNIWYKEPLEIKKWRNRINKSEFERVFKESLFIKRDNFGHENEMRILFLVPQNSKINEIEGGIKIKLDENDPFGFIEEIAVDPRLDTKTADMMKSKIISMLNESQKGLEKHRNIFIKQSDLYHFKGIDVIVDD